MADSAPLIIKKLESRLIASMPRARPDAVFVLSYHDGRLKTFRHAPGMADRAGSRWCYLVDVSQRFSSGELTVPARGDVYFFQTWFDAGWQVSDAEAVVRNNIADGEAVVSGFLSDAMWRRGRLFDPDDAQGAEEEITRSIRPPLPIGSGLVLTALNVRLTLDTRQATAASEDFDEDRAARRQADRVRRLRALVDGDESFLLLHLAEHQGDTGAVLQMLMQARERNDKVRMDLLDRMLERGFIQDADIGPLRDSVLGGGGMGGLPALPARPGAGASLPAGPAGASLPASYSYPDRDTTAYPAQSPAAPATFDPDGPQDRDAPGPAPARAEPDGPADGVTGWRNLRDRHPRRGTP